MPIWGTSFNPFLLLRRVAYLTLVWGAISVTDLQAQSDPGRAPTGSASKLDARGTDKKPFVVRILPSNEAEVRLREEKAERETKAKIEKTEREIKEKREDSSREARKKLDDELVRYNGLLVGVGGLQLVLLVVQLYLLFRHGGWVQKHERAYAICKPAAKGEYSSTPDGVTSERIPIEIVNYGRTPAFVKEIKWGLCAEADLPAKATYAHHIHLDHVLSPHATPHATRATIDCRHDWDEKEPHVIYGRVFYADIFKNKCESGFLVRVVSNGQSFEYSSIVKDASFTIWQ